MVGCLDRCLIEHDAFASQASPRNAQAFEEASGLKVKTKLVGRRPGDAAAVWAATETAERELGWKAKLNVKDMCRDQWRWASQNPDGFDTVATAAKND